MEVVSEVVGGALLFLPDAVDEHVLELVTGSFFLGPTESVVGFVEVGLSLVLVRLLLVVVGCFHSGQIGHL